MEDKTRLRDQTVEPHAHATFNGARTPQPQSQWHAFNTVPLTPVDSRYHQLVITETALFSGLFLLISTTIMTLIAHLPISILLGALSVIFFLIASIMALRYAQAKRLAYSVCQHEFVISQGLWWQARIALPYTRLQHVSLSQGPLERQFGLTTLKAFSAGSGNAEIHLSGLESHTAEHLRQHLLACAGVSSDHLDASLQDGSSTETSASSVSITGDKVAAADTTKTKKTDTCIDSRDANSTNLQPARDNISPLSHSPKHTERDA